MRQLTSLDAQFLALENDRQTGHVGSLSLYDGELNCGSVRELVRERLPLLPPFRYRLAEVPLGLDYPYWVDDTEFDLDYHVRELALPSPGSDQQLAAQVSRIHARPLDRSRPLWELYVIQGLKSGQVGLLSKIHHAIIDGLSGAEIMGLLLDLSPEGREMPDQPADADGAGTTAPGSVEMLGRGLLGVPKYPARVARALPSTLPNISDVPAIFGAIPGAGTIGRLAGAVQKAAGGAAPPRTKLTAPKTSFNGRLSPHRRFAFGQLPLEEVKEVKNHYGVTVNDVVVAICASAVRHWLIDHEELPEDPLIAQIPVSVRTGEQIGTYGNRILLMASALHTEESDPVQRLMATHEAMREVKERHKALPAQLLQDANHFIPPAIFSRAAGLTFRMSTSGLGRPAWNLVISNVPGPQIPLYLAGARLDANYPVSVITDGMGLNITVMSYCGHLDFGILADRDQMPDVWSLIGWLREGLEDLKP
jgi:diacylglycerol O-acyltransferase / wax synthase